MADWIIFALLTGAVTLIALLLYPQPIRWSDEPFAPGKASGRFLRPRGEPRSNRTRPGRERPAPRPR